MSKSSIFALTAFLLLTGNCLADTQRQGYVLRAGQGEPTEVPDSIIKASPRSGTQGGVVIRQGMPQGESTGLHYHIEADEFFHVAEGKSTETIGQRDHSISAGDFIFVPAGQDHELTAGEGGLVVVELLDKPGLDEEFRASFEGELTLEKWNEIARKYGTVYKTLD